MLLAAGAAAASIPWAFGYLLPQRGTLPLALAALAGYSPYALLLVAVVALAARSWPAVLVAVGLALLQALALGPAYVGATARSGTGLTVMTINMRFGYADAGEILAVVRRQHVDVLAVEELNNRSLAALQAAGVDDAFPHSIQRTAYGSTGVGLWTRVPVEAAPQRSLTFESIAGDIDVGGARLRIRVVHPPPPVGGPRGAWQQDYDALHEQVSFDQTTTTVLLGDFNASVHHRAFRRLMGDRWRDAAEVHGAGLVRTFAPRAGAPAVLDPDHVLVDRGMGVRSWRSVHIDGSDHRAVLARLVLPPRK